MAEVKRVAAEGDVVATPGSVLHTSTGGGSGSSSPAGNWSADPVTYTTYPAFKLGGAAVIWKAACVFRFSGTNTAGVTVIESETVTLTASSRTVNPAQQSVLVDGEQTRSTVYQNELKVNAAGSLVTT